MLNPIILTDADNTLWDTDAVFAHAQVALLSMVERATTKKCHEENRLNFVRRYDQALAAVHHAHLRYPPVLLVWALVFGLEGFEAATAAQWALKGKGAVPVLGQFAADKIVKGYLALLGELPKLLPTVTAGLTKAHVAGLSVYIFTEGKKEKQKTILSHYSLEQVVGGIFEMSKIDAQFERLKRRFAPAAVIVIGDQLDRDIIPAKNAGCAAVLVPSRFRPIWNDTAQGMEADFVASTFDEGIDWAIKRSKQMPQGHQKKPDVGG